MALRRRYPLTRFCKWDVFFQNVFQTIQFLFRNAGKVWIPSNVGDLSPNSSLVLLFYLKQAVEKLPWCIIYSHHNPLFQQLPGFILYCLCLYFWHLYQAWSFYWLQHWNKKFFYIPLQLAKLPDLLVKIPISLLKWESFPFSGVTGKCFVKRLFPDRWACFILLNEITSDILLEKNLIWHTSFNCWLLGKTTTPPISYCCGCTFHLSVKQFWYCLSFPGFFP